MSKIPVERKEHGVSLGLRKPDKKFVRCCPTVRKRRVAADKVVITGNTVVDAVTQGSQLHLFFNSSDLKNADFNNIRMVLATSHRRDSWGIELGNICEANNEVVQKHPDIVAIYPVHPNPLSKNTVKQILAGNKRTHPVKPLDYVTFIILMKKSYMIVTDSGGLQRESPKLRKRFLLLRNVSKRPEAFDGGMAKVVGTERTKIVQEAERLLNNVDGDRKMTSCNNPYGGGRAVKRTVDVLVCWFKGEKPVMTPF